jgi:hypothetical protein
VGSSVEKVKVVWSDLMTLLSKKNSCLPAERDQKECIYLYSRGGREADEDDFSFFASPSVTAIAVANL